MHFFSSSESDTFCYAFQFYLFLLLKSYSTIFLIQHPILTKHNRILQVEKNWVIYFAIWLCFFKNSIENLLKEHVQKSIALYTVSRLPSTSSK